MECLKTGQFPYMLQEPSIVGSKGRPKGAGNRKQDRALSSTQRNSSQFEYVEMKMKKEEATSKRKAKKLENEKNQKKMKTEGEKAVVVCADVNDAYDDDDNEDDLEEARCESDYGPLLPKYFYDISKDIDEAAYDQIINIRGDGFCGFRALAYQLFDNQDAFMQVKFAMRDRLVEVKNVYVQHFDNYDIDKLERIVTYGIRNEKGDKTINLQKPYHCSMDYWFLAPECAQLAACTFNRPVSVYFAQDAITFLPVFPQEKMKVSVAPLMMHIVTTRGGDKPNHWVTMKLRRSIKLKWPAIDAYHQGVMSALGKPNDIRFWQKSISFKKRKQRQSEKIVVEL